MNDGIIESTAVSCGNIVICSKWFDLSILTNAVVALACDNNAAAESVCVTILRQNILPAWYLIQDRYNTHNQMHTYCTEAILSRPMHACRIRLNRSGAHADITAHHRQCDVRPLPATCIQTNNINITTKRLNKSSPGPWGSQMAVLSVCRSPQRVVTLSVCPHAPSPTSRRPASPRCNPARTSHSCCGSAGRPWSGKLIYLWYYLVTNSTKPDGVLLLYQYVNYAQSNNLRLPLKFLKICLNSDVQKLQIINTNKWKRLQNVKSIFLLTFKSWNRWGDFVIIFFRSRCMQINRRFFQEYNTNLDVFYRFLCFSEFLFTKFRWLAL